MLGLGNSLSTAGVVSEVLPSEISGLSIWYKNDTGLTGDPVSQWDDSSGNSRHAAQASSDARGAVSDGGILFDDTDPEDFYDIAEGDGFLNLGGSQAFTIATVFKRETESSEGAIVANTDHEYITIWDNEQSLIKSTSTGGVASTFTFATDTFVHNTKMLVTITKDTSGNITFYKNGSEITPASTSNPTNTGANLRVKYFGARDNGEGASDFQWDGVIYEMALYNTELTGGDLTSLNSYLTNKFGL